MWGGKQRSEKHRNFVGIGVWNAAILKQVSVRVSIVAAAVVADQIRN